MDTLNPLQRVSTKLSLIVHCGGLVTDIAFTVRLIYSVLWLLHINFIPGRDPRMSLPIAEAADSCWSYITVWLLSSNSLFCTVDLNINFCSSCECIVVGCVYAFFLYVRFADYFSLYTHSGSLLMHVERIH